MIAPHPRHGGDLAAATAEFGEPEQGWIDLSTGISPWSWPVPLLPDHVWRRLPQAGDELLAHAAACYCTAPERLLPVPGSQAAITLLPNLFERATVAVPRWGYREHQRAWLRAGHTCRAYDDLGDLHRLLDAGAVHYVVVINPNNPTGELLAPRSLRAVATRLATHGGRLIVDEAFVDAHPRCSMVPAAHDAVIVLRSVGKFFGLAGIRLGFIAAPPELLECCAARLEPWAIAHPARWIGARALADADWQHRQRARLRSHVRVWSETLCKLFPNLSWRRTALFVSAALPLARAEAIRRAAGKRGVLLRVYRVGEIDADDPGKSGALLRIGLPHPDEVAQACDALRAAATAP